MLDRQRDLGTLLSLDFGRWSCSLAPFRAREPTTDEDLNKDLNLKDKRRSEMSANDRGIWVCSLQCGRFGVAAGTLPLPPRREASVGDIVAFTIASEHATILAGGD